MENNFTIDKQLNHRSIRKFKDQTLSKDQLETLYKYLVKLQLVCLCKMQP